MTKSRNWLILCVFVLLGACTTVPQRGSSAGGSPHYKVGNPYKVAGRWYHPKEDPNYNRVGTASWYGQQFQGRLTANGEIFDMNLLSAAHTTLPLPSIVEVTNLENGRSVTVRLNDRGPFVGDRIIDMSREAARTLGFEEQGTAKVRVRYVGRAPLTAAAPRRNDRVASAISVMDPNVVEAPAPKGEEISSLLTSIESAPALTPGAEDVALGEPRNDRTVEIPAADLGTSDPDDAKFVHPNVSAESATEALYIIRVAALSRLDNIDALRAQLGDVGTLRLSRVETETGTVFYRVNLGPYSSINTAAEKLARVRAAGYSDAALVTLTP